MNTLLTILLLVALAIASFLDIVRVCQYIATRRKFDYETKQVLAFRCLELYNEWLNDDRYDDFLTFLSDKMRP